MLTACPPPHPQMPAVCRTGMSGICSSAACGKNRQFRCAPEFGALERFLYCIQTSLDELNVPHHHCYVALCILCSVFQDHVHLHGQ